MTQNKHERILEQISIRCGPVDLLGRTFLKCVSAAKQRGIELRFATFDELVAVNQENSASWKSLFPAFDPRASDLTSANSVCVVGVAETGKVVATQALRLFDWASTNLTIEATTLRMFYKDPAPRIERGEQCIVSAPSASCVRGNALFSGATWYHPEYRGRQLVEIVPRFTRAYTVAQWSFDILFAFQDENVAKRGVITRAGVQRIERGVQIENFEMGNINFVLGLMTPHEIESDLSDFCAHFDASEDLIVARNRGA